MVHRAVLPFFWRGTTQAHTLIPALSAPLCPNNRPVPAYTANALPLFSNLAVNAATFDATAPGPGQALVTVGTSLYSVNTTSGAVALVSPVRTSVVESSAQFKFFMGSLVFAGANGRHWQCAGQ